MSFSTSMMEEGFGQHPLSPGAAFVRSETRESDSDSDSDNGKHVPDGPDRTSHKQQSQAQAAAAAAAGGGDDSERMLPPLPPPPSDASGGGRKQQLLRQPFRRSSSRYSSEFDDGGGMALPPLPEVGDCGTVGGGNGAEVGGSVRYPFLSNASTGVGGRGSYGGDTGPTLSRIPSSLSNIDSSEDEADALSVRNGGSGNERQRLERQRRAEG
eukprot:g16243.t1